jgi:protein SCO1/2
VLLSLACSDARTRALGGLRGVQLSPARAKPDFTLTDTDGRPFAFRTATAGTVTLLYFGYTNCPDVCPEHLSNIAAALKTMPADEQARVRVVFITTDPARDTPEHLRGWLNNFDRRFIGLSGNPRDVNQIESSLGLPASSVAPMAAMPAGSHPMTYEVGHAAQVLAFSPDDSLRTEYPSGFSRDDWKNDLPKLLKIGSQR